MSVRSSVRGQSDSLSGLSLTRCQVLDGYVALRVLRAKVKGDRTHYVYRRQSASRPNHMSLARMGQSHFLRDDSGASDATSETVPKNSGMGHENDETTSEFPNDSACEVSPPLIPLKKCPLSHPPLLEASEWDKGQCPSSTPRARAREGASERLPAWVTEPAGLDTSDPIGGRE